jgi:hypothetical protein
LRAAAGAEVKPLEPRAVPLVRLYNATAPAADKADALVGQHNRSTGRARGEGDVPQRLMSSTNFTLHEMCSFTNLFYN